MKRFFDESWVAKTILFPGYVAITLGPVAFSKKVFSQKVKNHECTHMRQWSEWTVLSAFILIILSAIFNFNPAFVLLSGLTFYVLYILEWFIRLFKFGGDAYRNISFEREAYDNEYDNSYNTNSGYFASFKYMNKKSLKY